METDQNKIGQAEFVEALAVLLRETFEGSLDGQPSIFLDRGVGIFLTLDSISATDASRDFYGTTIAAQTEHTKFYLDRLCEFLHGRADRVNWDDSWLIETVEDSEWAALRSSVHRTYDASLRCLAKLESWDGRSVGMATGMIAHTAYHLGAIRQIVKANTK